MITVEFKDFEDMMGFARNLVSTVETKEPIWTTPAEQAIQQTVQPVSVAPPVQQAAPVTPLTQMQPAPTTPAPTYMPPVQQAPPVTPPVQNVATTTASYTADDLARAGTSLMDSGRQGELLALLAQFGVDSLVSLQPAQYGAFATALRGLGAQI